MLCVLVIALLVVVMVVSFVSVTVVVFVVIVAVVVVSVVVSGVVVVVAPAVVVIAVSLAVTVVLRMPNSRRFVQRGSVRLRCGQHRDVSKAPRNAHLHDHGEPSLCVHSLLFFQLEVSNTRNSERSGGGGGGCSLPVSPPPWSRLFALASRSLAILCVRRSTPTEK